MKEDFTNIKDTNYNATEDLLRYLSFWKVFAISIGISMFGAFYYLKYSTNIYNSSALVEILDKSQDSDMALPTAMNVFNKSTINLENEIGIINSYSINKNVVNKIQANIEYYSVGLIKTSLNHKSDWFDEYDIVFKDNFDTITNSLVFNLEVKDNILLISSDLDDVPFLFQNLTTFDSSHNFPFDIRIKKYDISLPTKKIIIRPTKSTTQSFKKLLEISQVGKDSDQLTISLNYENLLVANEYLNTLLIEYDSDGVVDRQLEYKRTMDFVDSRSGFLVKELELLENKKQNFKETNNFNNILSDSQINIKQQFTYDYELFEYRSQRDLAVLLSDVISVDDFNLIPINIGLKNNSINGLISDYNKLIIDRNRYSLSAGPNNSFLTSLESQILEYSLNLKRSIKNHLSRLESTITSLENKELEFEKVFQKMPSNEKILRSIERELEVKESLFLLLLQKREEAAINFAVVKPTLKVIDSASGSSVPISPVPLFVYIAAIAIGFLLPFVFFFVRFTFDTKIHTKDQLIKGLNKTIAVIGEIPNLTESDELNNISNFKSDRTPLAESIRMLTANLNFVLFNDFKINKSKKNNIILVTSSIKGEGKTIISTNLASMLSSKFEKVLLIGADLRNPQIHKLLNTDKSAKGLTDCLYDSQLDWKKLVIKSHDSLDILLSGTIPPNPVELISSDNFKHLIEQASKLYDYVIIDSAPCLLVSDTFEISNYADTTLYVVRSSFSDSKLFDFINENSAKNKLSNINIVFNGVGDSNFYGYKYGYQYGYNYGYGYGYSASD